jgi:hypothetical protein
VLRTNLSTRPFYNERPVHVAIGLAALLVTALTVWNIVRVVTLSRQNTELATRVNAEHAEAEQLTKMAAEIRRRIDRNELQLVVESAREANALIDQRTFSWTEFFNRIESTLPPDVMLSAVRPRITNDGTRVTMMVLGRRAEDVDEFMEKLEATGAFIDVLPMQEELTEEGLHKVVVETFYVPSGAETPEQPAVPQGAPAPAPSSSPGGRP